MSGSDLVTNIVADASGFMVGADAVSSRAHELEHELKHVAAEIAGAFGVGLGLERGIESIKSQIEAVTELSHLSERTGIDVNDLRALQYEAKHTGTDFETLQNAIKKMQVGLGDAAGGGKKADVFAQLGLDPEALAAMDPAQAFAKIGDEIRNLENPTSRVHYAFEIFGKTGAEALNVITQGSRGLEHALDKVGLLNPDDIEKLKEAHESMLDLDASTQKLARSFATELAPGIKSAADGVRDLIDNLGGHGKDDAGFMGGLGAGIRGAIFGIAGVEDEKPEVFGPRPTRENKESLEAQFAKEAAAAKALEDAERSEAEFREGLRDRRQELIEKTYPEAKFGHELMDLQEDFEQGVLGADELGDALADAAQKFQHEMEARDPLKKLKDEAKHLLEEAEDPFDKFEQNLTTAADAFNNGVISQDEFSHIRESQEEKLARSQGLGELIDGSGFHAPTHIQGPEAITEGSQAYSAFFKGLQPNVDSEQAKHTALLEKLVDLQNRGNDIERQVASKITAPPAPLSIN